jgi:hypothetical protein
MKFGISSKISMLVGSLSAAVSITIGLVLHYGSTEIIFDQSLDRLKYETNIRSVQLLNRIGVADTSDDLLTHVSNREIADAILKKPFDTDELLSHIERLIS